MHSLYSTAHGAEVEQKRKRKERTIAQRPRLIRRIISQIPEGTCPKCMQHFSEEDLKIHWQQYCIDIRAEEIKAPEVFEITDDQLQDISLFDQEDSNPK